MYSTENFEFRGSAREWFGIWIVNLLLSVLTLGLYSAWAKVRAKKYFYQNTYVAGRNFDYHASGKQILIGRLVVIGALVLYSVMSTLMPIVALLMLLALFIFFPMLIVRSARFNARNSSWANVRFNFEGENSDAYRVYLGYPILVALSLYTTLPFLHRATQRFAINGHRLGKTAFHFDSGIGAFYKASLIAVVFAAVGLYGFIRIAGPDLTAMERSGAADSEVVWMMLNVMVGYGFLFIVLAVSGVIYSALIRNHIFASTRLGPNNHRFQSTVSVGAMLWITLSNTLAVICTLGLALPWAQIRMHRYLAMNSAALPNGTLEEFTGEILADSNAIGDAYSDIEGVDLGLSI